MKVEQVFACYNYNEEKKIKFASLEFEGYCRNLPFGERATRDSRVRLPSKEYARSRHWRLFEENIRKTEKRRGLRTF